jgi:hypothetical protein
MYGVDVNRFSPVVSELAVSGVDVCAFDLSVGCI